MSKFSVLIHLLFLCVLMFGSSYLTFGQTKVHIYIRSFIPKEHSENPGYVQATSNPAKFVIKSPFFAIDNSCFLTDNRLFNNDINDSARVITEFVLVITGTTVSVEKAVGRDFFRVGATHKVDCQTGDDLVPSKSASTDAMSMGAPAFADGMAQIIIDARVLNPLAFPILPDLTPRIDYGGSFIFDTTKNSLRFQGSAGVFPAFEAYAQLNDGPVATLFTLPPAAGTTAGALYELGSGFKTRTVDVTVALKDPLEGKWESIDADKRFSFEITGKTVKWVERGTANTTPGKILSRSVSLTSVGGKFRIERVNDMEALEFANFQPKSLRDAILAGGPKPSFIVFTRTGDTISAEFSGLRVTKKPDGTLNEIIQPGVRPPSIFTFKRIP